MMRIRLSALLFRRIHKWVGLVLGLQLLLWTLSGSIMALLPSREVGGHDAAIEHAAPIGRAAALRDPIRALGPATVDGLVLRQVAGRPVYEVTTARRSFLADAITGGRLAVDSRTASLVATEMNPAPVRSVSYLAKANLEAREHAGPMWRVDFADAANTSAYVAVDTGRYLVSRGDTWRTWDFFWMLHNMDYANRTSFNHPLIVFVAFGMLWLSLSGFYLLFKSFKKSDFRWLRRRRSSTSTVRALNS